jgi:Zn-dependent protease with chaperone function
MRGKVTAAALLLSCAGALALAQEDPKPGFNLFSVQQDVEIGRQSAAEAERQLPILRDAAVDRYLNAVLRRVAAAAPGAKYPYRIRAVDAPEVNAMTLPGGFMYVNRGLVEAARSEGELAGVIAHEVAHVALRHGTHQASKAYAAQAGLGILGGLLGRGRGNSRQVIEAIGGFGLNAVFLKFSREAEHDADLVGIRTLHRAGYDPGDMASFFEVLQRERSRNPGRLEQFFSSHPAPADRMARLQAEAQRLGSVASAREVGGFEEVRSALSGRPLASGRSARLNEDDPRARTRERRPSRSVGTLAPPSTRTRVFRQRDGLFSIEHPANWQAYPAGRGYGVVIAPAQAVQGLGDRQDVIAGVIINHYEPFDGGGRGTIDEATDDLVRQILRGSPHLRETGRVRRETVDGARGRSLTLAGVSPATGESEDVTVLTRELADGHVLYALAVAPTRDVSTFGRAFDRMLDSLRVDDRVAHR